MSSADKKFVDTLVPEEETKLVQAHIDADLHAKVKAKMLKDAKIKDTRAEWRDLIEHCFEKYLEGKI